MSSTPSPLKISRAHAQYLALHAQGLTEDAPFGKGATGVVQMLEHLGYVQIDTISVVERAHHHIFWSRVPDYTPALLHQLQTDPHRQVFEYWSHAAAYLPLSQYRFSLPRKLAYASGQQHWFTRNRKVMNYVLDRIAAEGPLMSKDFEAADGKKSGPWFDWKPTKVALEHLFIEGKLMIRERRGFQKVYDLKDRVLPSWVDQTPPSRSEYARHLIESTLRSHGLATEPEMRYLRKNIQSETQSVLKKMLKAGEIVEVSVEGLKDQKFFATKESLKNLDTAKKPKTKKLRILSPFDNFIIQRKRVKSLFDFDYQIECYVPEKKRKYGYFCLPLLIQNQMIGRLDAKADREKKTLIIQSLNFDRGFEHLQEKTNILEKSLMTFAHFNGCKEWEYKTKPHHKK